jgi:energy-coupling factor transporter ATP-binding protein EcfA2
MRARQNPFRAERIQAVQYRFQNGISWPEMMIRLEGLQFRAAIVGPEGSGKTTLLEELSRKLEDIGFKVVLRSAKAGDSAEVVPGRLESSELLLIDSAECFGVWEWLRLKWASRAAAGLIVTAHRPGLLPTLLECRTTPELFQQIVGDLLADQVQLPSGMLDAIYRRHNGNIRNALRQLYDGWSARSEVCGAVKELAPAVVQVQSC